MLAFYEHMESTTLEDTIICAKRIELVTGQVISVATVSPGEQFAFWWGIELHSTIVRIEFHWRINLSD